MSGPIAANKSQDQTDNQPPVAAKAKTPDVSKGLTDTGTPKAAKPVTLKQLTPLEALTAFLAQYSITDDTALGTFTKCQILSLNDLLEALRDDQEREAIEKALTASGSRFASRKFERIKD